MKRKSHLAIFMFVGLAPAWPQAPALVRVEAKSISRTVELPGELQPYLSVPIQAKIRGYVERVLVDRGSAVKQGQLLAELSAPEMKAQLAEAEAKVQAAESERVEAEARLEAARSTADRLAQASQTPGAIAGNELVQAQKQVDAAKALLNSRAEAVRAAEALVRAQKDLEAYLRITAPFDGVVIERAVHPGAIVGPGVDSPLMVLQQIARLRLVVAAPEDYVGGIVRSARVEFTVPAYAGTTFTGTVARSAQSLDPKTRTMPVELDVSNSSGRLSPGMYASVKWPVTSSRQSLLVPKTAVVTTTERTFVIRSQNGRAEWVSVTKGAPQGDLIELHGAGLNAGDMVVRRASDEIREGVPLNSTAPPSAARK